MPSLGGNPLKARMKSVALERDELRAKQRARLAAEADRRRKGLREEQSLGMRAIVDRLDLQARAGRRRHAEQAADGRLPRPEPADPLPVLPPRPARSSASASRSPIVFVLGGLPEQPPFIKLFVCIVVAYAGFYVPVLYVTNRATKRKQSIQRAWPDALDLMLICVESGMSVEAAFRKVADEIGTQSVELAEELVLTNAELSYLQERKQAYDNLASRTGLESVKSVAQALIQAERYGTPVAHCAARACQRKPRHAHERGGEEGGRAAAEAHRADDPVLPAGAVRHHPRPGRHPGQRTRHLRRRRRRRAAISADARSLRSRSLERFATCRWPERVMRSGDGRLRVRAARPAAAQLGALVFSCLSLVLQLLPGILLRQHRAEIGDVGLRLFGDSSWPAICSASSKRPCRPTTSARFCRTRLSAPGCPAAERI